MGFPDTVCGEEPGQRAGDHCGVVAVRKPLEEMPGLSGGLGI